MSSRPVLRVVIRLVEHTLIIGVAISPPMFLPDLQSLYTYTILSFIVNNSTCQLEVVFYQGAVAVLFCG